MPSQSAILVLQDGTTYEGISVGADGDCVGELVFNTSMTGYQEMLTDPSYAKQIIMFTTAHVGNTGCNTEDMESSVVHAAGLVMRDCAVMHSNYRAQQSLPNWLKKHGIVAISGVDTRDLTLKLRKQGAMAACISTNMQQAQAWAKARAFAGLEGMDLAVEVTRQISEPWYEGQGEWASTATQPLQFHIVAYDFGIKNSILKLLYDKGCHVTIVPAKTSAEAVLEMNPQGIFLSNGPGDPKACHYAIKATQVFLSKKIPIFGICLGFQILALACDGQTKKMQFGHHGANHPIVEEKSDKKVFISSQNHGFTVDEESLPDCLEITHRSLFDGSVQGIRHKYMPALGFQGHPEAGPGPHDMEFLFDEFIRSIRFNLKEKSL